MSRIQPYSKHHEHSLSIEGFIIYTTFFAITTFTIVEIEQELSENMNMATFYLQSIFLVFDVFINMWALATVFIQCYEIFQIMKLQRTNFTCYLKSRFPHNELNVGILIVLNIGVQILRICRRIVDHDPGEETFFSLWFAFLIVELPFIVAITLYEVCVINKNLLLCKQTNTASSF